MEHYARKTILLIILASLVRMAVAAFTELGNDEVYYRLYADPLQWNYFDHPPLVGWLIRLSTFNLLADTGFFIRLGAIGCGAFGTWLIYRCGEAAADTRAGFYAALLYTAGIYSSVIAGTFILPDSPQMVCWTGTLLLMIRMAENEALQPGRILLFGLITGIGMLCKIHTVFLWTGMGLFILLYRRGWLRHWSLYAAACITVLLFLPVVYWNVQYDFITFRYHGERVDVSEGGFRPDYFAAFLGGQILYTQPLVFVALVITIPKWRSTLNTNTLRILLLTALPLLVLANGVAFFRELLPHWTGPAFVTLMIPAAAAFAKAGNQQEQVPAWLRAAVSTTATVAVAGVLLIHFFPGTLGKQEQARKGYGDFTLDMYGWRKFAPVFDSIVRSTHPDNRISETVIVADEWFPAAHIDYYLARPLGMRMLVNGPVDKIHQYAWLNRQRGPLPSRADVYLVAPSNSPVHPENIDWLKNLSPLHSDTCLQYRNARPARQFIVQYYPRVALSETSNFQPSTFNP